MSKKTIGENIAAYGCMLIVLLFTVIAVWGAWNSVSPKIQEWAAPKSFATVDKDFKVISQYRTLAACAKDATQDARMFGSDSELFPIPRGCVNLDRDPNHLVFTTPYVASDWSLTFKHPGSDPDNPSVETVGHYPTLRDCLLAAIPLIPSDKESMSDAGYDCEYGPAKEYVPDQELKP